MKGAPMPLDFRGGKRGMAKPIYPQQLERAFGPCHGDVYRVARYGVTPLMVGEVVQKKSNESPP